MKTKYKIIPVYLDTEDAKKLEDIKGALEEKRYSITIKRLIRMFHSLSKKIIITKK